MASIKVTEGCLKEQYYGKLLSVQRKVIKRDRFGLSIPMLPILGSAWGEDNHYDPEDLTGPGIQRKNKGGTLLRDMQQHLDIFISLLYPGLK